MGFRHTAREALLAVAAMAVLLVGAAACGDDDSDGAANGDTPAADATTPSTVESTTVSVGDNVFSPAEVMIKAGEQVEWQWGGANAHSVVFDDGTQSEVLTGSGNFTRTFAEAGTYAYHCGIHGASMAGTVVVE